MKYSLVVLLALAPLLAFAQDAPDPQNELTGTLRFSNRDRISGQPRGVDADGNLIWHAPNFFHEPIPIRFSKIFEMRLEGGQVPEQAPGHQALLTLNHHLNTGDVIRGQLENLDDEHVTLKTWYGGPLKIRRSMVSSLEIVRSERSLYSGPQDIQSWTIDDNGAKDSWKLKNGVLSSHKDAGIARKIPTPERCRIGFKLAWRNSLKFRVLFFSDDGTTTQPENCYNLVCQRRFVYLRKHWQPERGNGGSRIIGQSNIQDFADKEKANLDFYIDRKTGTIAFYIDGIQAHVWTDPDPDAGEMGDWLHFVSENFYPTQISNIRVSPWTGPLPENSEDETDEEGLEEEGEVILLQNGDVVIGKVGQIIEGVLQITTKHCDMNIPVARIRSFNPSTTYEEPKLLAGDVRGWLKDGSRITFRLDSFTEKTIKGYSQTFGNAEFAIDAFSRIEFNIHNHDPQFESLRATSDW